MHPDSLLYEEEEEEEEEMNLLVWLSCRPWKHMYKPDGHRVI